MSLYLDKFHSSASLLLLAAIVLTVPAQAAPVVQVSKLWSHQAVDPLDTSAAEIVAIDHESSQVFVTNANSGKVDILNLADGVKIGELDTSLLGGPNSVAVKNNIVAVALESPVSKQDPGSVAFFRASDGAALGQIAVGSLPDMVTFTPDGSKVLVANEGEPNDAYTIDPVGSVSIIDISGGIGGAVVTTAGFATFDAQEAALKAAGVRIFGPGASVSQDLEPEYITADNDTAWVSLQENNAIATVNLNTGEITEVRALGTKDHSAAGNALDPSDDDGGINIANWPVKGLYQPDSIASYEVGGQTYLVTANEGDARDYAGFSEEERIKDLTLNPANFADPTIQDDDQLGRLAVTNVDGHGGDDIFEELYSFGARSFSIFDADTGALVFDSGDIFEQVTAALLPDYFNINNDDNVAGDFDKRSDAKGPEPEALTLGSFGAYTYAFIGLERIGGFMIFDITNPLAPLFQTYINEREFEVALADAGDLGPEGLSFIPEHLNPLGNFALLAVANEVSGSTTLYALQVPLPGTLLLMALGLTALRRFKAQG